MDRNVYKLQLEYYPKIRWVLKRQKVRELSENDKAAGFSPVTWEMVADDLHTRMLDKAEREAKKILQQRHPDGRYILQVEQED
jgi:hypothetical protein